MTISRRSRTRVVICAATVLFALPTLSSRALAAAPTAQTKTAPMPQGKVAPTPPQVIFTDITQAAGISFVPVTGAYGDKLLPETMGGGVAFLDYDNDGDPDLLFVNGAYWPGQAPPDAAAPTFALYRNDGGTRFKEVTSAAGLASTLYGMGVAVGDYDNDGWVDLYITAVGKNRLFHNQRGVFHDVTDAAGVGGGAADWGTGAAFVDVDNDGDLDLFGVNYVEWSSASDIEIGQAHAYIRMGDNRAFARPYDFPGTYPFLFRNEGNGRFVDISKSSGIQVNHPSTGQAMSTGLAVMPVDVDRDGLIDLVVCNDKQPNFLFHNQGAGHFVEKGLTAGVAYDADGVPTAAMGIDAAHYRNDSRLAIAIGNYAVEHDSLFVSRDHRLTFVDLSMPEGIGAATRIPLTFGLFFFDYDLDGRLDLLQANGHLEEEIAAGGSGETYAQAPQLFWNCGDGCPTPFVEVAAAGKNDLFQPLVGRGAAYADIDGDGDLDVVFTQIGRRPALLRNDQKSGHHWVRIRLVARGHNRDAIGAWLELHAGGITQYREVMPTRSYLSQVELPATFGLGKTTRVDSLHIRWPDGTIQVVEKIPVDAVTTIEQPSRPNAPTAPAGGAAPAKSE